MNNLMPLKTLVEQVDDGALDGRVFIVTVSFLTSLLEAFLKGDLTAVEVSEYAEFLDVNDDVDFQEDEITPDVVFRMSSPEINGLMTPEKAVVLLNQLRATALGSFPGRTGTHES